MKWKRITGFLTICFACWALSGCRGAVHERTVTTYEHGDGRPADKKTVTYTETVKIDRAVPVYRMESTVQHHTETRSSDRQPTTPLHTATVTAPGAVIPDATK